MSSLNDLYKFSQGLMPSSKRMPVLFVGHGSPMNGIEDNEFSRRWLQMGKEIPKPKAVLCISAHWLTRGTYITAMPAPKTIHDFGGFPKELSQVQYNAPGSPALAKETAGLFHSTTVHLDHDWGFDHGCWSVVKQMYPEANIPVLQFSIDYSKPASYHYALAKELSALRDKGVLILGSGNMVHNLGMIAWDKMDKPDYGFDWAIEINEVFKKKIQSHDHQALVNYESLHKAAKLAIPSPDHYYPLMYILGLQEKKDELSFFNDKAVMGSVTMTSVRLG
jgi:4,5-DOPA dioxygenase extradiol